MRAARLLTACVLAVVGCGPDGIESLPGAAPAPRASTAAAGTGSVVLSSSKDGLEVRLEGATVREAMEAIAARTGLAVKIDGGIGESRLYVTYRAATGLQALRTLASLGEVGLEREEAGGVVVYRIGTPRAIFATDLGHLLLALLLVLGAFLADRILDVFLRRREKASRKGAIVFKQLAPLVRVGLWVIAGTSAFLVLLNVPPHTALALTGGGLLIIGFASREFAANILAGLAIAIDRPLHQGDFVSIGPHAGEVVRIGLRSTQILTLDDTMVTLPNSLVATDAVASANYGAIEALIPVTFYVSHEADLSRVRELVWEGVVTSAYCSWRRPVQVVVSEENWATRVVAHAYVFDVRHQLLFETDVTHRVKVAFDQAAIQYPKLGAQVAEVS